MKIQVGDILNINVKNDNILGQHRETKYGVVVVSIKPPDNTFKYFVINTDNRKRYECIEIKKENYSFLKNERHFISCSSMFVANKSKINSKLNIKLTENDKNALLQKVKESHILSKNHKDEIFNAFNVK